MTLIDRLTGALGGAPGSSFLSGDGDDLAAHDMLVPAAVLVAVTDRVRPGVVGAQRTETLRQHPGQVAFPGGRIDPGEDAIAAALREADEEIALPPSAVSVIGVTDRYRTGTGYTITPVVAVVPADLVLVPSEAEVAGVFEVPLDHLLDPANHRAASAEWRGAMRHFYEILWEDRRIWGATAGMIVNLSRRLRWAA